MLLDKKPTGILSSFIGFAICLGILGYFSRPTGNSSEYEDYLNKKRAKELNGKAPRIIDEEATRLFKLQYDSIGKAYAPGNRMNEKIDSEKLVKPGNPIH